MRAVSAAMHLTYLTAIQYAGRMRIMGILLHCYGPFLHKDTQIKKSNHLFILYFTNVVLHAWLGMISNLGPIIYKEVQVCAFDKASQATPESSAHHS